MYFLNYISNELTRYLYLKILVIDLVLLLTI
jgi:hypothetical protein